METPVKYSDKDLEAFKTLILKKIEKAQHDLELIKSAYMNDLNNGSGTCYFLVDHDIENTEFPY